MLVVKDLNGPDFEKNSVWIRKLVDRVVAGIQASSHSSRAESLPYVVNALEQKHIPYVIIAEPEVGYQVRANPARDKLNRDWPDNLVRGRVRAEPIAGSDRTEFRIIPQEGDVALGCIRSDGTFELYNYQSQIEDVARRFVACWNFCQGLDDGFLERATSRVKDKT